MEGSSSKVGYACRRNPFNRFSSSCGCSSVVGRCQRRRRACRHCQACRVRSLPIVITAAHVINVRFSCLFCFRSGTQTPISDSRLGCDLDHICKTSDNGLAMSSYTFSTLAGVERTEPRVDPLPSLHSTSPSFACSPDMASPDCRFQPSHRHGLLATNLSIPIPILEKKKSLLYIK